MMPENSAIPTPFTNPLIRFIADRRFRWLRHSLFILFGLILAYKGDIAVPNDYRTPSFIRTVIITDTVTFIAIMALMYFLLWFLVPRLLFRNRVFLFSLSFLAVLVFVYFFVWFIDSRFIRPVDPSNNNVQHIELSFVHFVQISAVSGVLFGAVVGLAVFKKWINDVRRMNELQQTNLKTELEQLKSQVNPHFLFNTLNNLLVLVKTDADKASQVLFGLSDLLRYQLYDSARDRILLSKDIQFIRNLLDLEKIRKNDFTYEIETKGRLEPISLPPFLFIPFVENAIKHGASSVGHSYLRLQFDARESALHFIAENSKPLVKSNLPGGLGLKNIRRRLELLYPGNHTLRISDQTDTYIVNLIIPI
jgi:sensor histidine kinase YesM